jgi:hypothetical protein
MGLHGSARHVELARNLGIVTALQKEFDDLLFARSQPNGLLRHHCPLGLDLPPALRNRCSWNVAKIHSTHIATLRQKCM